MSEFLLALVRANLAGGIAVLIVLALRGPARRLFGSRLSYGLWLMAPLAGLATLLPGLPDTAPQLPVFARAADLAAEPVWAVMSWNDTRAASWTVSDLVAAGWALGVTAAMMLVAWSQARFARLARDGAAGPAVIGAIFPRLVIPADFHLRFDEAQRQVILDHERMHLARRDAPVTGLMALLQCLCWFNPLAHVAAYYARLDQELACDADVVARFPETRRIYAEAMLKTQLAPARLPLGCYWPSRAVHPLEERIAMLKTPLPGKTRRALGAGLAAALILAAGYAAWAADPVKTPTSGAATAWGSARGLTLRIVDDSAERATRSGNEKANAWGEEMWLMPTVGVTGEMVASAKPIYDQMDRPAIAFTLTPEGKARFADLTRANVGRRLAIIIDGEVISAPKIATAITGGEGVITGKMNSTRAKELAKSMTTAGTGTAVASRW